MLPMWEQDANLEAARRGCYTELHPPLVRSFLPDRAFGVLTPEITVGSRALLHTSRERSVTTGMRSYAAMLLQPWIWLEAAVYQLHVKHLITDEVALTEACARRTAFA